MLSTLPTELVCLIAGQVDNHQDLFHLASTCWRLHNIIRPNLFTTITLTVVDPVLLCLRVSGFLAMVLRIPNLATDVRFLDLGSWDSFHAAQVDEFELEYDTDLLHPLVDELNCSTEEKEMWKLDLKSGITDAWLALLLPRLPNLERIRFVRPHQWNAKYVDLMLGRADPQHSPMFSQLREVHAAIINGIGAPISVLFPFFKFPAIRKIVALRFYDSRNTTAPLPPPTPNFSEVTDLGLQRCESEEGMEAIIASCKVLKSFRLTWGGAGFSSEGVFWGGILDALCRHETTLTSLSLCADLPIHHWMDEDWEASGFLEDFTALQHLHIGSTLFLDLLGELALQEILPPSLQSLCICGARSLYLGHLIGLCTGLIEGNALPKLASLCIVSVELDGPPDFGGVGDLRRLCQESDVSLRLIHKKWPCWEGEEVEESDVPSPDVIFWDTLPSPDWCL